MELKGRLGLIAEMIPACNVVCDIGTDHAYIPIYLVSRKICRKAIAADLKKGPILKARQNIKNYNMEALVETRLGYGLEPIKDTAVDIIIIAGMGGMLIRDIISGEIEIAKKAARLILQPMNAIELLREWLYESGFEIFDERLVEEGEKIYDVIAARWTGTSKRFERTYYHIGEKLIENRDPLLNKYLKRRIRQIEKIISGLGNSSKTSADLELYEDLKKRFSEALEGRI